MTDTDKKCVLCGSSQRLKFRHRDFEYWRCPHCQLMSTYPLPDAVMLEWHYAKRFWEGNYALYRDYVEQYSRIYRGYAKLMIGAMGSAGISVQGARVLDIGCYTGDFLCQMQREGADVYGVELQPEAVEVATHKLPGRIHRTDVLDSEFPVEPCDAVSMLGVIEHVLDPMSLLTRSIELLKPGGVLLLETPNSTSSLAHLLGRFWPPYAPVEHIHLFSRRSLKHALTRLGMTDVVVQQHWKHLPISYVYKNLGNFGPELQKVFEPVYAVLPRRMADRLVLPFYIGEILVIARKRAELRSVHSNVEGVLLPLRDDIRRGGG